MHCGYDFHAFQLFISLTLAHSDILPLVYFTISLSIYSIFGLFVGYSIYSCFSIPSDQLTALGYAII